MTVTVSATVSQQDLIQVGKKPRLTYERRLWLIIFILSFIVLIFLIALCCVAAKRKRALQEICNTKECIHSAGAILSGLNRSVDPCEDFYAYTCSKWTQEYTTKSWFNDRSTLLQNHIAEVLMKSKKLSHNSTSARNAKILMDSCMNTDLRDIVGLTPMVELLENVSLPWRIPSEKTVADGWNLAETLAKLQLFASMDVLFQLSVIHGYWPALNNTGSVLQFRTPKDSQSSLPLLIDNRETMPQFAIRKTEKELIHAKINYIRNILKVINKLAIDTEYHLNQTEVESTVLRLMLFEANITKLYLNSKKSPMVYLKAEEFQNIMDEENLKNSPNRFDVKKYIEILLGPENFQKIDYDEIYINIIDINYFKKLRNILAQEEPLTIQRYVWWKVIKPIIPHLNSEMDDIRTNYYLQIYENYKPNTNTRKCLNSVKKFYSSAINFLVAKQQSIKELRTKVSDMFEDIRNAFINLVIGLNWMDVNTKLFTLKKARAMKSYIGYADWMKDSNKIDSKFPEVEMNEEEYLKNMLRFRAKEVHNFIKHYVDNFDNINITEYELDPWDQVEPYEVNAFYKPSDNAICK